MADTGCNGKKNFAQIFSKVVCQYKKGFLENVKCITLIFTLIFASFCCELLLCSQLIQNNRILLSKVVCQYSVRGKSNSWKCVK